MRGTNRPPPGFHVEVPFWEMFSGIYGINEDSGCILLCGRDECGLETGRLRCCTGN